MLIIKKFIGNYGHLKKFRPLFLNLHQNFITAPFHDHQRKKRILIIQKRITKCTTEHGDYIFATRFCKFNFTFIALNFRYSSNFFLITFYLRRKNLWYFCHFTNPTVRCSILQALTTVLLSYSYFIKISLYSIRLERTI